MPDAAHELRKELDGRWKNVSGWLGHAENHKKMKVEREKQLKEHPGMVTVTPTQQRLLDWEEKHAADIAVVRATAKKPNATVDELREAAAAAERLEKALLARGFLPESH